MTDEFEIREIENQRTDAILRHDLPVFFSMFSPEFIATNPYNKVLGRDQVFELFEKGIAGSVSTYKTDIEKISFINGFAVVMGEETLIPNGTSLNAAKTIKRRFTNIWIKDDAHWKITVRQATIISIDQ